MTPRSSKTKIKRLNWQLNKYKDNPEMLRKIGLRIQTIEIANPTVQRRY